MVEASFNNHFQDLLGTSLDRDFSLDLDFLGLPSEDLAELEAPFTEEEISEVAATSSWEGAWPGWFYSGVPPKLLGHGER
jgi:hypothetical protein